MKYTIFKKFYSLKGGCGVRLVTVTLCDTHDARTQYELRAHDVADDKSSLAIRASIGSQPRTPGQDSPAQ